MAVCAHQQKEFDRRGVYSIKIGDIRICPEKIVHIGDVLDFQCSESREKSEDIVVTVEPSVQEEYDIMVSRFVTMFSKVMDCIYAEVGLKKIKEHLIECDKSIRNVVEKCTSTKMVNTVLREQVVKLVNYGRLKGLADAFEVPKALVVLEKFDLERDEFFKSILAKEFATVTMEKIRKSETTHLTVLDTSM